MPGKAASDVDEVSTRVSSCSITRSTILFLTALLFTTGCETDGPALPEYWPTDSWRTADPETLGVDDQRLADMFTQIADSEHLVEAVVVVKDGYIVAEGYREPFARDDMHEIHSCTKSLTGAAVGLAISDGAVSGVDASLSELFPDHVGVSADIRLEDLLTMRTGLRSRDSYLYRFQGLRAMQQSGDWLEFALGLPAESDPGTRFDYSNVSSFLLGAAVEQSTGRSMEGLIASRVFAPLGITTYAWPRSPRGITLGYSALRLRARDLAKFGLLYLHDGRWEDRQIIPERWVEASWTRHVRAGTLAPFYGYQWWLDDQGTAMALGYRGQYLIVAPDQNLVVVFLGTLQDRGFQYPEVLYRRFVLPAVRERSSESDGIGLTLAIARFESGIGASQPDAVGDSPAPMAAAWQGTYDLEQNVLGMTAISLEPDDSELILTEHYGSRSVVYRLPHDSSYAESIEQGIRIAARGGWNDRDELAVVFLGVGSAFYNRLAITFGDGALSIRLTGSFDRAYSIPGTRR